MRLGLRAQVRRVWAPRGIKIRQKLQLRYEWQYLVLGLNGVSGQLRWGWTERMRQGDLGPVLKGWELEGVVWDRAGSHRGKQLAELGLKRVFLPPYSPELNPAERVFEELRRAVEGRVFASLADKQAVVEKELKQLADDTERLKQLAGWRWIREALATFP